MSAADKAALDAPVQKARAAHGTAQAAIALVSGLVFGAGLVVSGMTQPVKVIGFLDLFGAWDASLMLVMGGAIGVHFFAYRWIAGKSAPLFAPRFAIPTRRDVDARLLIGAVLFGAGWGIGGYCPGPGVVSAASGATPVLVFVAALVAGTYLTAKLEGLAARTKPKPAAPPSSTLSLS
jgi:uncharacterized membrane protein YedE/YeeE